MDILSSFFSFKENNTTLRTEVTAGTTTFLAMAYIIFVQPQVLGAAGMDAGAVMVATCLAAAIGSIVMGMLANYPIGVAPGMGENFFFTYTVVLAMGISWQKGLAIIFVSGVLFILLTLFKIREMVITAVPDCLKHAIAVGIGVFISLIGLHDAGIIVANPSSFAKFGDMHSPVVLLSIAGFFISAILVARGIKGSLLIGMLATAILGVTLSILKFDGVVSMPPSIAPTFLQMDIAGILDVKMIAPIIIFLYMALFDTIGTLLGVTTEAGIMKNGIMPRASKALMSDAVATTVGAALGTTTTLAYVESMAGVKAGGRTGFAAIVVGCLFLVAIFFSPLVKLIGGGVPLGANLMVYPVTAPVLIIVGAMMMWGIKNIDWANVFDAIPAFLTIIMIPFTYSIADGIAAGFISYPVIKLFGGKGREVSPLVYVLAMLFLLKFIFIKSA